MHYPWCFSVGVTGWVVQNIWWEYEYGGRDPEFLREKLYPMLRDAALFYTNFINTCQKLPEGKVQFGPSVSPEHFGWSNDLSKNWNDIIALVYARFAGLRAKGGFLVSSENRDGKILHVSITATADQLLRLKNPFNLYDYDSNLPVKSVNDEIQCKLLKGQILQLALIKEMN